MAKHQKKDRKAKQAELMLELWQKIKEAREAPKSEVVHPDRDAQPYKDTLVNEVRRRVGKHLKPAQVALFLPNVIIAFPDCLYLPGRAAPRVEGFVVGSAPRVQQPFNLSEHDRTRLEDHEDQEVADEKAVWAAPGEYYS